MPHRTNILRPAGTRRRRAGDCGRRGSVYLLVLGTAVILTVIGLAAVAISRVSIRSAAGAEDWAEAQTLAFSGAEHAMAMINSTTNWRAALSGQTVSKALGRGTFTWQLVDDSGGALSGDPARPFAICSTGAVGAASYAVRAHMTPGGSGIAIVAGLSAISTVSLASNAIVDSFDSSLGPYGGSNVSSLAVVRTNSTVAGGVSLASNSGINGSVQVGPGGDPDEVISRKPNATITGATSAMPQAMAVPALAAPTNLGASTGNLSYSSNSTATISGNLHVNNLSLSSNSRLRISGTVTILADGDFSVASNSAIEVLPNSSLTVYVSGSLTISSNACILDNPNLSSMKLYNLGTSPVTISSNASFQGVIVSPHAPVVLNSNAQVHGAVLASSVSLSSNAKLHEDKHITNQGDPVVLPGGNSRPQPDGWTRVVR
ncbi:MAG: hypothetical protein ACE15C_10750 [Phycisphaerae bacterium]